VTDTRTAPAPIAGQPPHAEPVVAPLPWREIVRWALLGCLGLVLLVMMDVSQHGGKNPVSLIQPGTEGPSTEVIARDFPEVQQPEADGLDGQQYYAIARNPWDLDEAAASLDWPRYRLGRPLLPWAAWLLHPTGGGVGLISALLVVGFAGAFGGALASGALSTMWRGPAWVAAVFPMLPGAFWSVRVTVSDALALGLALGAVALAARSRYAPAVVLAVLAALAKEPMVLVFAGWALHRRTRRDALLVAAPIVAVVGWMAWLAFQLPPDADRAQDLGLPFVGLVSAFTDVWSEGDQLVGMACTVGGLAVGALALIRRGLSHPLGWAIALQLGFMSVMGVNPTSVNFGATRMAMPIMILAVIALATPKAPRSDQPEVAEAHTATLAR
jgi:hypothetical protein